jgi:hypothetical protein
MKKCVWTLNINNYAPEITAITRPLMCRYAQKIGADFCTITKRKFSPNFPVAYEKLQLFELGRQYDWNIFMDADTLVHPDFFDPTDHVTPDTIIHNGVDMAGHRWRYDRFFRRDGRHLGSCNWFTCATPMCIELWEPLTDLTLEEALANIFPTAFEVASGEIDPAHLLDDYVLSRNIAKYGLKAATVLGIMARLQQQGHGQMAGMWHWYAVSNEKKIEEMHKVVTEQKIVI